MREGFWYVSWFLDVCIFQSGFCVWASFQSLIFQYIYLYCYCCLHFGKGMGEFELETYDYWVTEEMEKRWEILVDLI